MPSPYPKMLPSGLEKIGVTVVTGTRVEHIDEQGVIVAGTRIESATMVWTAGVAPSLILNTLGVTTDHAGHVRVGPLLEIPNKPGNSWSEMPPLRRRAADFCPV